MIEIIKTGSKGNAVIYNKIILLDCGVPYSLLKDRVKDLKLILLTHEHKDHINIYTIKKILEQKPSIRIGCGEHMLPFLEGIRKIDVYQANLSYDYNIFKISPIHLFHDVPNFGYRIFFENYKIIHATDTYTLEHITAKDYDLYAIEHNCDEEKAMQTIIEARENGDFTHKERSFNSHLSEQQARDWLYKNANKNSKIFKLHESQS